MSEREPHLIVVHDVAETRGADEWRAECCCGWLGTTAPESRADWEGSRHVLKAKVLAFAENKMHAPWLKELAGLFDE